MIQLIRQISKKADDLLFRMEKDRIMSFIIENGGEYEWTELRPCVSSYIDQWHITDANKHDFFVSKAELCGNTVKLLGTVADDESDTLVYTYLDDVLIRDLEYIEPC